MEIPRFRTVMTLCCYSTGLLYIFALISFGKSYGQDSDPDDPYILSWNTWLDWSDCSQGCRGGQRTRIRWCEGEESQCEKLLWNNDEVNISYDIVNEPCLQNTCNMDGYWGTWAAWSNCSITCDSQQALSFRSRPCVGRLNNGNDCKGDDHEVRVCDITLNDEEQAECDSQDKQRHEELADEGPVFRESDKRPSAIGTGTVAWAAVLSLVGLIVAGDMLTCSRHIKFGHKNMRRFCRRKLWRRIPPQNPKNASTASDSSSDMTALSASTATSSASHED